MCRRALLCIALSLASIGQHDEGSLGQDQKDFVVLNGRVLVFVFPLPVALLAGMGFVAVFSGATNTPFACTAMGIELFGMEAGWYIAIACLTAYLASGHTSIYRSQIIGIAKPGCRTEDQGKTLSELDS